MKTSPTQVPQERGPGWLSDLLARASVDDEDTAETEIEPVEAAQPEPETLPAVPTAPAAESRLQAIAFDVTRLIDDTALMEAWERFRQGERSVFTRRIYTLPGQQTYDEVRRRFRSDPEFRETVNRYTQEFERVLRETAPTDGDGSLTRGYLGSETGKVYTILAHAAGRLD